MANSRWNINTAHLNKQETRQRDECWSEAHAALVTTTGVWLSHLKKGRCSRSLKTNGEEICKKIPWSNPWKSHVEWPKRSPVCCAARRLTWYGKLATQTSKKGRSVLSTSPTKTWSLDCSGLKKEKMQQDIFFFSSTITKWGCDAADSTHVHWTLFCSSATNLQSSSQATTFQKRNPNSHGMLTTNTRMYTHWKITDLKTRRQLVALPSWLFPAVSPSCYRYRDQPLEPHQLVSRQPGQHVQKIKPLSKKKVAQSQISSELHTLSMIALTTNGFLRMCCPMPVLNTIPVTEGMMCC